MKKTILAIGIMAVLAMAGKARADFLGLAPGDYSITLDGSSSLCGGTNCVGTVHIGTSGSTDFDFFFQFTIPSLTFDIPNTYTSVVEESATEATTTPTHIWEYTMYHIPLDPIDGWRLYGGAVGDNYLSYKYQGAWTAIPRSVPESPFLTTSLATLVTSVPEPPSLILYLIGGLGLLVYRKLLWRA